jgi:hypothetical protein
MIRDPFEILRELAKNDYYQSLYSCAKELGLQVFQNTTDLTKLQLWFLSFMGMYSVLNTDIAIGDVSERVLENSVYEDSYMMYKKHTANKDIKKKISSIKSPSKNKNDGVELTPKSSWVFKRNK